MLSSAPQNIHVAHFVIDGVVRRSGRSETAGPADSELDPDAIARTYVAVLDQPRSAWSWEVELRPWGRAVLSEHRLNCFFCAPDD